MEKSRDVAVASEGARDMNDTNASEPSHTTFLVNTTISSSLVFYTQTYRPLVHSFRLAYTFHQSSAIAHRGKKARCKEKKCHSTSQQHPPHQDCCGSASTLSAFLRRRPWLIITLFATFFGICWVFGACLSTFRAIAALSLACMLELYLSTIKHKHSNRDRLAMLQADLDRRLRGQKAHTPRLCDLPEHTFNLHRADRLRSQQLAGLKCAEREAVQQELSQRSIHQDPRQHHDLPKRLIPLAERAVRRDFHRAMISPPGNKSAHTSNRHQYSWLGLILAPALLSLSLAGHAYCAVIVAVTAIPLAVGLRFKQWIARPSLRRLSNVRTILHSEKAIRSLQSTYARPICGLPGLPITDTSSIVVRKNGTAISIPLENSPLVVFTTRVTRSAMVATRSTGSLAGGASRGGGPPDDDDGDDDNNDDDHNAGDGDDRIPNRDEQTDRKRKQKSPAGDKRRKRTKTRPVLTIDNSHSFTQSAEWAAL